MSTVEISFNVNADVVQSINILDKSLSGEDIVAGLESGDFVTTLGHAYGYGSYIVDTENFEKRVAEIIEQSSEGEYTEFN